MKLADVLYAGLGPYLVIVREEIYLCLMFRLPPCSKPVIEVGSIMVAVSLTSVKTCTTIF